MWVVCSEPRGGGVHIEQLLSVGSGGGHSEQPLSVGCVFRALRRWRSW